MRWVVNAMRRPLYRQERDPVTIYRRLGVHRSRSGWVRKILPPPELDPRTAEPVASRTMTAPRQMVRQFKKINCRKFNLGQYPDIFLPGTTSDNQETAAGGPTVERGTCRTANRRCSFYRAPDHGSFTAYSLHPPIHPATCTVHRHTIQ